MSDQHITYEELIAELESLGVPDEEGETVRELCERWGCSEGTAREKLLAAKRHGLLRVSRKMVELLDGRKRYATSYVLEVGKKRGRKK